MGKGLAAPQELLSSQLLSQILRIIIVKTVTLKSSRNQDLQKLFLQIVHISDDDDDDVVVKFAMFTNFTNCKDEL